MATHIDNIYKVFAPSGGTWVETYGTVGNRSKIVYNSDLGSTPIIGSPGWQHPIKNWSTTLLYMSSVDVVYDIPGIYTIDQYTSGSYFTGDISLLGVISQGTESFKINAQQPSVFSIDFRASSLLNGMLTSDDGSIGTIDYNTGSWMLSTVYPTTVDAGGISASFTGIGGANFSGLSSIGWKYTTPATAVSASVSYYGNPYNYGDIAFPANDYLNSPTTYTSGSPELTALGFHLYGGVEYLNFNYDTPGTKIISAYLVDTTPITAFPAMYTFDIHEISGSIISQTSEVDHWYYTVSAVEWEDQPFVGSDILSWTVYSNQGFVSADYVDGGLYFDGGGATTNLTAPTGYADSGISNIEFHYNTPGIKTLKASKINPLDGTELISTNVTYVAATGYNNDIPANGISSLEIDLPTLSSMNFYSSALSIIVDSSSYVNRTIDLTLYGSYGNTYGGINYFTIPSNTNMEWLINTTEGLSTTGALSGSYSSISALQLSSVDQAQYELTAIYTGNPTLSTMYTWQSVFEPTNIYYEYEFNNCSRVRSLTATAKTRNNNIEYNVLGEYELIWDTPNNDSVWNAQTINGFPYTFGTSRPASDVGTIIMSTEPLESSTPSSSSTELSLVYSTTVSVISTILYDGFPSDEIFNVDFIMNKELASHSNYTDIWRVNGESSAWGINTYTANLSAQINNILPTVGIAENYVWEFDDSNTTGITTTKIFDTTVLPTVCSISLTVSCLSVTPEFIFPHTKTVNMNIHFVESLSVPTTFIYPKYGWYDKSYNYVDTVIPVSERFDQPLSAYGEGDVPYFWLSANNIDVASQTNIWWLSGGINNTYKVTGKKASWKVPFTYVGDF